MKIRPRPSLHYPDWPLHQFLRNGADQYPERVALRFDDQALRFRELDAYGTCFANALRDLGLMVGDRMLLIAFNRPEWLMAQHGASQAGCSTVLGNASWKAAEIEHALGLTKPMAVVADAEMAAVLVASGLVLPRVKVCLDDDTSGLPGWLSFWDLVGAASGMRPPDLDADLSRLESLLPFSSGTTGLPKAVRHSHKSLVAASLQRVSAYDVSESDRLQYFMPLFTAFGMLVVATAFAGKASLRLFRRFDPETVLHNIQEERITVGFAAAPVAVALRDRPDLENYDCSSVRYFMWGATPIMPDVANEVTRRCGIRFMGAYAATEIGIASNPAAYPEQYRLDTPGYPLSDCVIRIVDVETGEDVAPGGEGELVVKSASVMMGYLPDDANDEAFLDGAGGEWFRTGDVGWMEPEGWVHLTDRAKELIKVSGFSVSPAEIEKCLFGHAAVADTAVWGMKDERRGEMPAAAVVVAPGHVADAALVAELKAYVSAKLANYKQLKDVIFVESIPRNAGGKVLRRVLKADHPGSGT
ncbi:MAG: class I adenylate-forming enzyme family protein [Acidimicrobiia bacterium]